MQTHRNNPIDLTSDDFRRIGHDLIDTIADFISEIREMPVTSGKSPQEIRELFVQQQFPETGESAGEILSATGELLIRNSLHNGHPKFLGYITSSAAPLGMLADLLASAVNPNCGANILSPVATAIERQTIAWLTDFIGIPATAGGILVSGGNMANLTGFLAGRTAKAPWFKKNPDAEKGRRLTIYCSKATHTWIDKAVTLFGHGNDSLRWISVNKDNQMDLDVLRQTLIKDRQEGFIPMMLIGTAGDVSTGVVDDLEAMAGISEEESLWFHVDGAYGGPAAILPELKETFRGLERADSIALDPHKWLYSPLEAGCTLVRDPQHLVNAFSAHPEYYNFSKEGNESTNFYEYGLQNSRGFRALKVWLSLRHLGRMGYVKLIREDIALAEHLYRLAEQHDELEAATLHLSIATLRYVPQESANDRDYLNRLNEELLNRLQANGEAFLSNAIVNGNYCLRACVVNFRTTTKDMEEIAEIIVREGRELHQEMMAVN